MIRRSTISGVGLIICILAIASQSTIVHSQSAAELEQQISTKNNQIDSIKEEIALYEKQIATTQAKANTLQNTVDTLTITQKKLSADVRLTQSQIDALDLQIEELSKGIDTTQASVDKNGLAVAATLRQLHEADNTSMIEAVLTQKEIATIWREFDANQQLQVQIANKTAELQQVKTDLEDKRTATSKKEAELTALYQQLDGQRAAITETKNEQSQLLKETKNQEATYQKILKEKKAAAQKLADEVQAYEDQLKVIIDPTLYPKAGTQVFQWPLSSVRITQLFGNTLFAKQNASVYGGRPSHNGVDFAASPGTPIHAPLSGVVVATGNTDSVSGCYSWGRWIFIDHKNGLSTIYAHLSSINVSPGQSIDTGQVIGFSGYSGYVDPPGIRGSHLHFGVYITQATRIVQFTQIRATTGCAGLQTPVAPENGYVDPLSYLPTLD